jgi:serine/threonine-protein kinase RsbW
MSGPSQAIASPVILRMPRLSTAAILVSDMAAQTTGPRTAADGELRLELAPQLPEVARMVEALEAYAERTGLPTDTAYQVTLVLDELVTNIVSYGVAPGETRPITLSLSWAGGVLEIVLSDPGKPFDPRSVPPPDTGASLDDRRIGGLGVHIARSFMDSLDWRHDGGRNHLTLVKRIEGGA